jgi:phospholipid/cholesterol/gamma-HCH transport system permease protein
LTPPSARPVATAIPAQVEPRIAITTGKDATLVRADGIWLVHSLGQAGALDRLDRQLASVRAKPRDAHWDLSAIDRLDHFGAQYLWNFWGHARPAQLKLGRRQEEFFDRLYHLGDVRLQPPEKVTFKTLRGLGQGIFNFCGHMVGFIGLLGQLIIDLGRLIRRPARGPWTEVSANIFHAGTQALGITALVGFLIGVVLSYLSAQQLRAFGADIYIVNILGMAIIRELGPTLAAILVAGRSGSAITAQLGVMRVTEELDAMLVMGIPHGFRLILPRVLALAIAMPLLVLWTDALAIFGGMVAAKLSLGMSLSYFFHALPDAVSLPNLWLGVGKGAVFGMLIALTACHFGLRIEPNTASLGEGTTSSVVTAITVVILADAVFAILFKNVGV